MTQLIEVTTTCNCQESARKLARQLVDERLAACVQISGPIESVYRWEGAVQVEQEWMCTIKTLERVAGRLIDFITAHHDYQTPQILFHSVVKANAPYAAWVQAEVDNSTSLGPADTSSPQ